MPEAITYTSRRGRTYYLCEVTAKNGKARLVFSREPRGKPVAEMPAGHEAAETVDGQVVLRKLGTSPISEDEIERVRAALRRHPHLAGYRVDTKKDTIVVYEPQGCVDPEIFRELGLDPGGASGFEATRRYSPVFRFKLIDPQGRIFSAERMCYRSSREGWLPLHTDGPVEALATRYVKHLGKDSLFELF